MIFIIGGACQGKTAYAKELLGENGQLADDYHRQVWRQLKEGKDPLALAESFLQKKKEEGRKGELVIVSSETGCGLVPVDSFEREYRELCGRVNCYFAKEASRVFRVICGIGSQIK